MTPEEQNGSQTEPAWITWIEKLTFRAVGLAGIVTAFMALQIVVDVISRNVFNRPLPGTIEMATYWWMPTIAYLAIGYAQMTDRQIRVMLLVEGGRPEHVRVLDIIMEAVCGAIVAIMIFFGTLRALDSYASKEAGYINPWLVHWPGRAVVVVGLVITLLAVAARIGRLMRLRGVTYDEFGNPLYLEDKQPDPEVR